MKYTKPLAVLVAGITAFSLNPFLAQASSPRCMSDSSLSSFARQRVNSVATDLQGKLRMENFADEADYTKSIIDRTSLRTGGVMRDIYIGGANTQDKQDMVEEYLRNQLGNEEDIARGEAQSKANNILAVAQRDLNQFAAEQAEHQGSGSSSRSISSVTTNHSRSGSFKLQRRGFLGLSEDVGRFNYTVTNRVTVSVQDVRFSQRYNLCSSSSNQYQEGEYHAKVVISPSMEVRYQFSHLGSGNHYNTFSGHFTILNQNDDRIEREIDGAR